MRSLPPVFTTPKELRHARVLHDMTQEDLADILGVSRITLSRVEAGQRPLTLVLARAASLLFDYLDKPASTAPARAAKPFTPPKNVSYAYSILEPPHGRLTFAQINDAPPGTRYRMATLKGSNLSGWQTMVRGEATVFEDKVESAAPTLSDQAWLDNVAKRFE